MNYYQKLANYLPELKNIDFDENTTLKITKSKEGSRCIVDKAEKFVILNLELLTYKERNTLEKIFKDHFDQNLFYFVDSSKINLIERLYNFKEDKKVLESFKNLLSTSDFCALRDSLFLRSEFINQQGNTRQLKNDIVTRYGERGNVISNLCTAGYFEEVMIPLSKKSVKDFFIYYDIAVDKGIVALFVNNKMTVEKLNSEIAHKLSSAKKYGLEYIHIHGIGKGNILKIENFLKRPESYSGFEQDYIFHDKNLNIYVVELKNLKS
jgi:hypothetical protein